MLESNVWWGIISGYNQAIGPWSIVLWCTGTALSLLFIVRSGKATAALLKSYLIAAHAWTAGVFFLNPATGFPSPMRQFQGGLFVAVALLLIWDLISDRTVLAFPKGRGARTAAVAGFLLVFAYPLWGILLGHDANHRIYPGAFPCSNTALTLLLVILAKKKRNPVLYVLLLIWAIPFPPTVQLPKYGAWEDSILFTLGLIALVHLIGHGIGRRIRLKTTVDRIAVPDVLSMVRGILKGYISHPRLFLLSTIVGMPGFLRPYRKDYPKDFLRSAGFIHLMYVRLSERIGNEKAFEVVRSAVMCIGLATQQANFRTVEAERSFANLVEFQKRTNREGPTRLNTMEIVEDTDRRYEFKVTRCLFHEFFSRLGTPELTACMCSVDNAIFNTYLPEEVTFHRKGLGNRIVDGNPYCRFVVENRRLDDRSIR